MDATLDDIALFVLTVRAGSLSAAAAQKKVPKSTVSRAITRLEEHVGTRLLTRSPRNTTLTDAGKQYFDKVAPHVAALHDAEDALRAGRNEVQGVLRVTAAPDADELLAMWMQGFCARYPKIRVVVDLSPRVLSLQTEGFDVAIRATSRHDPNTVAKKLRDAPLALFASPGYLAARGTPETVEELAPHDCVVFRERQQWTLQRATSDEREKVTVRGRLSGDEFHFVRSAVRAGVGIGPLPAFYAERDVRAGVLVRVLPQWIFEKSGALWLVYPAQKSVPPRVKAFRDYVLAMIEQEPSMLATAR
jgi:DNA-binding transcriptional LysR family regulator